MSFTRAGLVALMSAALCVSTAAQVTVPNRPASPLFQGAQGEQRSSDIHFDPTTRTVTMSVSVQDRNGYFVPNLHRSNFAVFEDGVRQRNVTVEIEHAPVTLAVLVEMGGRSQQLNKMLGTDAVYLTRPLLDVLGRDDKLALFTYDDSLHTVVNFTDSHQEWDAAFDSLKVPQFSEANFYDAAIQVLERLTTVPGRKALVLVTTGIDTFSHATWDEVVKKAETTDTPIYALGLGDTARRVLLDTTRGVLGTVSWSRLNQQLEELARISGGRAYVEASTVNVATIFDDMIENLRVRYVITYVSSNQGATDHMRSVQVRLVNPTTGGPLRLVDAKGRRVTARVLAQASYSPT